MGSPPLTRASTRAALLARLALGAAAAACTDPVSVPALNAPSTAELDGPLTRASLQTLATGFVNQARANTGLGYVYFGEAFARDAYRFDPSESRYLYEAFTSQPSTTSFFGGSQFANFYTTIRAGATLLAKTAETLDAVITQGEKAAVRGFVRTVNALEYYRTLEYHDTLGVAIQVADSSQTGRIVCANGALAFVSALLDSAHADLQAAAAASVTAFPFALPSGFVMNGNYTNVAAFATFNRGLKGKVELYRGIGREAAGTAAHYAAAVAALDAAIGATPTTAAELARGPYWQFSTAPGEIANPLADPNLRVNPQAVAAIDSNPGDLRRSKIVANASGGDDSYSARTYKYTTGYTPAAALTSRPANFVAPLPILRAAELVLLRAQAKIGLGDLAGAAADVNVVRTLEGGLAPVAVPAAAEEAVTRVLYEKRFSLFFEGPQRLVDLRAYKRFKAPYIGAENAGDLFNRVFSIPQAEADARGGDVAPSCA